MVEGSLRPLRQKSNETHRRKGEKGQVDSRHSQRDEGAGLPCQDAGWMKSMRTMYGKGKSGAAPHVLTSRQCGIMAVSDGSYRPSTSSALTCRLGLRERSWVSGKLHYSLFI